MRNKQTSADKHSRSSRNTKQSSKRQPSKAVELELALCRKREYNETETKNKSAIRGITAHRVVKGLGGGSQRAASRDSKFERGNR